MRNSFQRFAAFVMKQIICASMKLEINLRILDSGTDAWRS